MNSGGKYGRSKKETGNAKTTKGIPAESPDDKLRHEGAVLISVRESAKITGIGITNSYRLARKGVLPTIKIDGRVFIHRPKLMAWLDALGDARSAA